MSKVKVEFSDDEHTKSTSDTLRKAKKEEKSNTLFDCIAKKKYIVRKEFYFQFQRTMSEDFKSYFS